MHNWEKNNNEEIVENKSVDIEDIKIHESIESLVQVTAMRPK